MAEHLRHRQARARLPVRPRSIRTLARFLDEWAPAQAAPAPLVVHLAERAIRRLRLARFDRVAEYRGFHTAVAAMLEEAPAGGLEGDWGRVLAEVERELEARGMARRNVRLQAAARAVETAAYGRVTFDGFFSLGPAEVDLIAALGRRTLVHVTLPDWPTTASARRRLLASGFREDRGAGPWPAAGSQPALPGRPERPGPEGTPAKGLALFAAQTIERETEEIARRILEAHASGRKFREMAIVLRAREPYGAALETALARFGIPARFYFSDPLAAHPAVMFLAGLVRAMLAGWDRELLLAAVRMPVSGIGATPEGDRLDFEWRDALPAQGLPKSRAEGDLLARLAPFDALRRERLPAREWAERLGPLRELVPVNPETVPRSTVAALQGFAESLGAAALAFDGAALPLEPFWRHVETVLSLEALRVPDRRRDVLHVMDAFEARQWELPVIFVCGLIERHFPQYHREDPLLGDAQRLRLGLDTAMDRQATERFLFDFVLTRATEQVFLSYPRYDERGEETLPSFFLDPNMTPGPCETRVRPRPREPASAATPAPIQAPALLAKLAEAHQALSPTAIESFLQCPFQFFAAKTLRLRLRPPAPRDRLDPLLEGSILHRALAEWTAAPLLGVTVFDRVFEEECARRGVPATYRTEAVRLELRRDFENFLENGGLALRGWTPQVEQPFLYALDSTLAIRGRIDRLEQNPAREALLIDYKYSAETKIRERVERSGSGDRVQAGLYLAAAERAFGLAPAGMLFCGLKKDVTWDGWHTAIAGLEAIGTSCTGEVLRDLIRAAEESAATAHDGIQAGRVAADPADTDKCHWCEFRDICRVETVAAAKAGGA
jgi:hypothetical protein